MVFHSLGTTTGVELDARRQRDGGDLADGPAHARGATASPAHKQHGSHGVLNHKDASPANPMTTSCEPHSRHKCARIETCNM